MATLTELASELATGKTTARTLVENCLERIDDPNGEGTRAFIAVHHDAARCVADGIDQARAANVELSPFAGIPVSIKDLFDIKGEVTRAGSLVLQDEAPALRDAPVVQRLRAAGFIVIGRANMTEFAYSGLGVNVNYQTPRNPYDRQVGRIPGGSSSGGAVSVADGMAVATLGTDTGGSCRIPAALCGIVGYKPTQARVPLDQATPLSSTLDSIGPLANSVSCCAILDAVVAGGRPEDEDAASIKGMRLGVPQSLVLDNMDSQVSAAFSRALTELSNAGAIIEDVPLEQLLRLPEINANGGFAAAEAYAWHRPYLERKGNLYDPWIKARIEIGAQQSAADYIELLAARRALIAEVTAITSVYDAMILPTVPIIAPTFDEIADPDEAGVRNQLLLRNTAVGNFLNRCAISIPCHDAGSAPVGLMLMGETGADRRLFQQAKAVEACIHRVAP